MATATVHSDPSRIKTLVHAPASDILVDTLVLINSMLCIAYEDVDTGVDGQFICQAEEVEAPLAAVTVTEGSVAYWDNAANNFTNVVGSNTKQGYFRKAAGSSDGVCFVTLDGTLNL